MPAAPLFPGPASFARHYQTNEHHYVGRPFFEPDGEQYVTSHVIEVFQTPVVVKLMQCLPADSKIVVQQVMFEHEVEFAMDVWIQGRRMELHNTNTQVVIDTEGRYKLRLEGCAPEDVAVLQHQTGSFSTSARIW